MDFMELATARYSVRDYDPRPIEEEKLAKILEAGRIAPTAKNNQCHRVYVLKSEEALAKIRALTRCAFNAPVVMLFAYNKDEEWHNPLEAGITAGSQDCAIVATHMMLQAQELGVGSCWVCFFPNTAAKEALGLPDNEQPVLLMPMGYPAAGAEPSPRHFEKKPLESLVREL
jgi:nitroreductase